MIPTILPPLDSAAAAFPCLTRRDLQSLVALARRFMGCDHLAQDAVQEALLSLSQQREPPERPIGWLTKAVIHRSRHLRRTVRRRRHHEHLATEHCDLHEDCDNPLHVAIAHELGERLTAVRSALPEEQRLVLDLYEGDELDYRTIAETLEIPIGTVRSRLARARQALRMALALEHGCTASPSDPPTATTPVRGSVRARSVHRLGPTDSAPGA